jgi:2-isopropylmalate synthase
MGARAVVRLARAIVEESGAEAGVDLPGHDDSGRAQANALAAIDAGATRIHATALGIGERVGNTAMDVLLVNLVLLGHLNRDLTRLAQYCAAASEACGRPIPVNYPIFGEDAFRTATGVHAAAIVKAGRRGERDLVDAVYCSVPASLVGRTQRIEIGPMSGRSNVVYWLEHRGLAATDDVVERICGVAKQRPRILQDDEIWSVVAGGAARADIAGGLVSRQP